MKNFSLKTRENSLRNYRVRRIGRLIAFIFAALLCIYLLGDLFRGVTGVSTRALFSVRAYLEHSSAALPVYLRDRNELLRHMNDLETSLSAHDGDAATIARLEGENTHFRSLLGVYNEPRIAAGVIARPPWVPYDVLYLDRGSDDGVLMGAVVYYADDHAIGFVSRVFKKSALVTLFSSPGVESTVYVFGPNVYATAQGEGGGVVRIPIPQGIEVHEDDAVVLPTIDAGTLGVIEKVISNPTDPEQDAYLTFATPVQSMYRVSVSTKSIQPITFEEAQTRVEEMLRDRLVIDVPESFMFKSGTTTATSSAAASSSVTIGTSSHNQ